MNDRPRTRSTGLAGVTNLSLLAPLRTDMVPGVEPMSYVGRLRKVLTAVHASRQNLRESELLQFFPDVVGRFGIIRGFRYVLVEPDAGPEGLPAEFGTWRLSLNVTFDGGWEPYMRVIRDGIGPLLDLLFCHAQTYKLSKEVDFEGYCDWVRRHEVPAGLFYAHSATTVDDDDYLADVEALQRKGESDTTLALDRLASEKEGQERALNDARKNPERALALPLRALKGLYRLTNFFPSERDSRVLLRFAQDSLRLPIELMNRIEEATEERDPDLAKAKPVWRRTQSLLSNELNWLDWKRKPKSDPPPGVTVPTEALQAHVLGEREEMTHACLVLLQVTNRQQALETIAKLAQDCEPVADGAIGCLVGFTYAGLHALAVTPDRLAALPQEFVEGMEARCAVLGDLRTNHPDRWARPSLLDQEASGQFVDFRAVHLMVQLRLKDGADDVANVEMHPRLTGEVAIAGKWIGLRVLAVEPMRSYRDAENKYAVGHMGIADGLSQPTLNPSQSTYYSDKVKPGELLLGYSNGRGDPAPKSGGELLKDGSFLAVRKLRQFMERLDKLAPPVLGKDGRQPAPLLEKMVGRAANGAPLPDWPAGHQHENDFNFDSDEASKACPFHSHIRRCNPRDGRYYTPRILRRGMSWGPRWPSEPNKPRGAMFMAYCASLAEQFEVIQRWVAGGNSSGAGSAQGDPLLRVPKEGESYTFRYLNEDGEVQRVHFDDKPLVQLQWGLYAFVPSLTALRNFATFTVPGDVAEAPVPTPGPRDSDVLGALRQDREALRALFEDRDKSETIWRWVREGNPLSTGAYGKMLGKFEEVLDALTDNNATRYSVRGYGERMHGSIGLNLLGMDPSDPRYGRERPVKEAIAGLTEDVAFAGALRHAQKVLEVFTQHLRLPTADDDNVERLPIDLVDFSNVVIAGLCTEWFGLPDTDAQHTNGTFMGIGGYRAGQPVDKPLCPGSFGPASRYMFMPHPQANLIGDGVAHATAVSQAVKSWLEGRKDAAGRPDLTGLQLSAAIQAALPVDVSIEHLVDNIAGTMLGFAPSVQSNFLRAMETWIEDESLWTLQQSLFARSTQKGELSHDDARAALREPLLDAMCKHPVPTMAWRSPVVDGRPMTDPSQRVVLGLQSALRDQSATPRAQPVLVFGRHHDEQGRNITLHGCPGYELAMGVMLALIGSLMKAGTLRPTGSPVLLILTKPKPTPP